MFHNITTHNSVYLYSLIYRTSISGITLFTFTKLPQPWFPWQCAHESTSASIEQEASSRSREQTGPGSQTFQLYPGRQQEKEGTYRSSPAGESHLREPFQETRKGIQRICLRHRYSHRY